MAANIVLVITEMSENILIFLLQENMLNCSCFIIDYMDLAC